MNNCFQVASLRSAFANEKLSLPLTQIPLGNAVGPNAFLVEKATCRCLSAVGKPASDRFAGQWRPRPSGRGPREAVGGWSCDAYLMLAKRVSRYFICLLFLLLCAVSANGQETVTVKDTLRLSLQDAIDIALEQSVNAAMARNKQKTAYWQYRTFRAEQLPEIAFTGTLPNYRRNYTSYQSEDGSYKFVRNNNIGLNGGLSLKQIIPFTGGNIALSTTLDYTRQIGADGSNEFMSVPVAITLSQPILGVNTYKWDRKIEPVRYEESQAQFAEEMEEVTLSTISYFFNFLLAESNLNIAKQNLRNAQMLYDVAVAKREIGKISERELMQMKLSVLDAKSALTDAVSSLNSNMFQMRAFLGLDENQPVKPLVPENAPEGTFTYRQVLDAALEYNAFAKNILRRQLEADYAVASAKGQQRQMDLYASFGFSGVNETFKGAYQDLKNNQVVELGLSIPILDWGKRKGQVKIAESNREVIETQIKQDEINFNQNIFLLVENYNNQAQQLQIAIESDSLATARYEIAVKTFMVGEISILDLNDAREVKDSARAKMIRELYYFWNYFYNIRSVTAGELATNLR